MDTTKQLLLGVVLPGTISLVVFLLAWASATAKRDYSARHWSGAVAVGLAFCAGFFFLLGWPELPPADAIRWLPWFAILGAVIGIVDGSGHMPYMLMWIIRLAASAAMAWILLEAPIRSR